MSINIKLASRWVFLGTVLCLLSACNSTYFSVKKTDLVALDQCQQLQQTQQVLLQQQQQRTDETLTLLQENTELRKQLVEMTSIRDAIEPIKPAIVCPELPKPRVVVSSNGQALYQDKQLVGEKERVLLASVNVLLRARINTGITTSFLDARDIQIFERNGEEWVRFTVLNRDDDTPYELERKRVRYLPTGKSDDSRRPIVELRITIGKLTQVAEFILADRSNQPYPIVIGRNVLRDVMLVDVSRSDLAPVVREVPENEAKKSNEPIVNEKTKK